MKEKNYDRNDIDYRRAKVFFEKKIPIHVSLKSGSFYNGYILEKPNIDFFILHDRKDGYTPIFYIQLKKPIVQFQGDLEVGE